MHPRVPDGDQLELSPIARDFYAGRYAEVIAASIDSPSGGSERADTGFVVAALAFVGRLDEAELLLEAAQRTRVEHGAHVLSVAAFGLAVAYGRAGDFSRARSVLRRAVTQTRGLRDSHARALLLQGAACLRFFAGDYRAAARTARAALASAIAGQFAYGQLLAGDLTGHVLFRLGRHHEGFATLERARKHAVQLGLTGNARAIAISIALQRAALAPVRDAIAQLREALAGEAAQDSYSRRAILLELGVRLAWAGDASAARACIEDAAALAAGDARALVMLACARAQLVRVEEGYEAASAAIAEARGRLAATSDGAHDGFVATASTPHEALARGLLGLIAEASGRTPGMRLHLFDEALVIERKGNVAVAPPLSPRMADVLDALAEGPRDKPALLAQIWGIRRYRPEQHDSVVKTTISRLRAALGDAASFVETEDGTYRLASGVEWIRHVHRGPALAAAVHQNVAESTAANAALARKAQRQRRVLAALGTLGEASVGDLAQRVRSSIRTASRDLSELHDAQLVRRAGAGRSTRYRLIGGQP